MEGGALNVVSCMKNDKEDWSQGGCLLKDACVFLNSFDVWSISHVCREANLATHQLAKNNLSLDMDWYELDMVPQRIWQIVMMDVSNSI